MTTIRKSARRPRRRGAEGFTLMELLVVIGVIALVAAVAVPSIVSVFTAGADIQAYNLMAAQLTAARSEALQSGMFVGVHVQITALTDRRMKGACYAGVVALDANAGEFKGVVGYRPRKMPGPMAFGELPGPGSPGAYKFLRDDGSGGSEFQNITGNISSGSNLADFTSFTVVFSPGGAAVRRVPGGRVQFGGDPLFAAGAKQLWNPAIATGEYPTTAMTLFDFTELESRSAAERVNYLKIYGQYLPVNVHTGQLFPRE